MLMFRVLLFFIFASSSFGLSITLNNGKTGGNDYYILHIENEREFSCQVKVGNNYYPPDARHDGAEQAVGREYHCYIEGALKEKIADQHLPFMDMYIRASMNGFLIQVIPKIPSRLVNIEGHLFRSNDTKQAGLLKSTHYTIVMDKQTSIALAHAKPELDFPIVYPDLVLPSIGALDFNKDPLALKREGDITEYITIKNLYDAKRYDDVIEVSTEAAKRYPNSVFMNEFRLYLARSLYKADEEQKKNAELGVPQIDYNTRLLAEAKSWVRSYASDKAYPEMLFMLMQAYINNDNKNEADYTLSLLMTEHEKSPWMKKALLSYADSMFASDRIIDSIRLYEDVYYMTDEIDIASLAGTRLAIAHLRQNQNERAKNYLQKILSANVNYLANNKDIALNLANAFKANELNAQANKIYKIIFENTSKKDPEYEIALRQLALSPDGAQNSDDTYSYLMLYQVDFPNSDYISLINTALDRMFFNVDLNQTSQALHASYADLMSRYEGSDIYTRALKEDVKLYFKEGGYKQILALKDSIRDTNDTETKAVLTNAAIELANSSNQQKNCAMLMLLIDEYGVEPNIKDRYKLYDCYMRQARFDEALATTSVGVESGDLNVRTDWLSNAAAALYSLGRFEEALKAADDAIYEAARVAYADPSRAIYYRFYSLLRLNRWQEALGATQGLENIRGAHLMLIELYDAAAKYAAANGLDSIALSYAKKTIDMQTRLKISTYSPEIDFIYIDTLKRMGDDEAARIGALKLLPGTLSPDARARALYAAAEIEIKKGLIASAKEHIQECISMPVNTPWKALCKEQNELLKD